MAVQIQQFVCTVPAGTPEATPVTIEMQLGIFEVSWVEILVPPGPSGQVGFYLASSNTQTIPWWNGLTNSWIVADNELLRYDLSDQPDSGDWQFVAYNQGNFPHSIYVRFGLDLVTVPASLVPTVTAGLLSA